jgi:hypothetical protein
MQSTEKDLKGVEGSVCMPVPKTYEAAQPLQTNSPAHKEELSSRVAATVMSALCLIDGPSYCYT